METANKRRQYFIDRKFQAKFIFKFCLIVVLSSLLIGTALFFISRDSTTVTIENTEVKVKRTADFILPLMILTLVIVAAFSAVVVSILTLLTSHKISGPLYRLRQDIDILKDGDLRRNFSIRSKDQLQELAKSLNSMCQSLREKQAELKKKIVTVKDSLNKDTSAWPEKKIELLKNIDEIDNILNFFKVE